MFFRVLLAGLLGGAAVFAGGFMTHMLFDWSGRTVSRLEKETAVRQFFFAQKIKPGIYGFPSLDPTAPQEAEWNRVNELYKEGPAAYIIVAPTGEDMMNTKTLVSELVTNILAALLAAWIVAQAAGRGFLIRWLMVLVMGIFAWFSLSTSYAIWYRFPMDFIRDELYCSAFEWGLAGIIIASFVRVKKSQDKAAVPAPSGN